MDLAGIVSRHAAARPEALAATADASHLTYAELEDGACRLGSWLRENSIDRLALLASRSLGAFVGVVGAGWAGAAYVPLSLKAPSARIATMLAQVDAGAILIDRHGAEQLDQALRGAIGSTAVIAADEVAQGLLRSRDIEAPLIAELEAPSSPPAEVPSGTAYIIFTSGTTGVPKGVVISFAARRALTDELARLYPLQPFDRVAETADLSFDISVANMLLAWTNGASLHAVPASGMIAPARFIRSDEITVWCSVPTVIANMQRSGVLRPGVFPTLRHSIFIGETLPVSSAEAWQLAAPMSTVDNLYGPTEACFGCFGHRLDASEEHDSSAVPIGLPFGTTDALVVDEQLGPVPLGGRGELAIGGAQLADGYLHNPELTDSRFPLIDGRQWYLTGDSVRQDSSGLFHHLGRIDNQLKIRGYRVELEDVESHLLGVSGAIAAAVLPWMDTAGDQLVGFVVGAGRKPDEIRTMLADRLPAYMIPAEIHSVASLPLSANGKLDRRRLPELLRHG